MDDLDVPAREALEDENRRLRAALAEAGIDVRRATRPQTVETAQHRAALAESRAWTGSALEEVRRIRLEAEAAGRDNRQRIAEPVTELGSAQEFDQESAHELATELQASRAALAVSEERLAFAFESSGFLGWWDWDVPADRLYADENLARMLGIDPAVARAGAPASEYLAAVHPDDREWIDARVARLLSEGGEFREEYRLLGRDGRVTWLHARGRCYRDAAGRALRYPGVALDITDRKASELRKDALVELGERLRGLEDVGQIAYAAAEIMAHALGASRTGYGLVDSVAETVRMQTDWRGVGVASIAGLHRFRDYGSFIDDLVRGEIVIIEDVTRDPRTRAEAAALLALGIRVLVNVPIIERGRLVAVVFVHHDGVHAWSAPALNFVRTVADRAQAAVARVRAEEQQRLLNQELSHRLKNSLALVQSIAAQTMRNAPSFAAAQEALSARLIALGKAHDILLSGDQESAEIAELVRGTLTLHADHDDRFAYSGPCLRVVPQAALSLALMLHELATNAAKYGALSRQDGRVRVAWSVAGEGAGARFRLAWTERGGPPVSVPTRRGFGSRLILRGLSGGGVDLSFPPEGVACTLETPMAGFCA